MARTSASEVTRLLERASAGDADAFDRLMPLVYEELHDQAARLLRRERPNETLRPTALLHEAYLRMVPQRAVNWKSRTHFLAVAGQMMRRVLVDHARTRRARKRGGDSTRVALEEAVVPVEQQIVDVLALDEALEKLSAIDSQQCRVVELRFFAGLTADEMAAVLGISPRTVRRDWNMGRAWLRREMARSAERDL